MQYISLSIIGLFLSFCTPSKSSIKESGKANYKIALVSSSTDNLTAYVSAPKNFKTLGYCFLNALGRCIGKKSFQHIKGKWNEKRVFFKTPVLSFRKGSKLRIISDEAGVRNISYKSSSNSIPTPPNNPLNNPNSTPNPPAPTPPVPPEPAPSALSLGNKDLLTNGSGGRLSQVFGNKKYLVVKLGAFWCGPCQTP